MSSLQQFRDCYAGVARHPRIAFFERSFAELAGHVEGISAVIGADGHSITIEPAGDANAQSFRVTATRADGLSSSVNWHIKTGRLEPVVLVWGSHVYQAVLGDVGMWEPIRQRREFTAALNAWVAAFLRDDGRQKQ